MLYEVITHIANDPEIDWYLAEPAMLVFHDEHGFAGTRYVLAELVVAVALRQVDFEMRPVITDPRITSYNVCYTKLLRRPILTTKAFDCVTAGATSGEIGEEQVGGFAKACRAALEDGVVTREEAAVVRDLALALCGRR